MITWQCIPQSDGLVTLQATQGVVVWWVRGIRSEAYMLRTIERVARDFAGLPS